MIEFTNRITIDRGIETVFEYLADLEHVPEWNWAVTSTRKIDDGPVGVGTRYRQTRSVPRPAVEELVITQLEAPHVLSLEGTLGPFPARVHYRLTGGSDRTAIVNTIELDPPGLARLAAPVLSRRIGDSVASNLRDLRDTLEDRSRDARLEREETRA